MSILAQIVSDQRKEVSLKKAVVSELQLRDMPLYNRKTHSFSSKIKETLWASWLNTNDAPLPNHKLNFSRVQLR